LDPLFANSALCSVRAFSKATIYSLSLIARTVREPLSRKHYFMFDENEASNHRVGWKLVKVKWLLSNLSTLILRQLTDTVSVAGKGF